LFDLFVLTLIVCGVIFLIVAGLIAWCVLRYPRRDRTGEPPQVEGHTPLEIGWTLAFVVILTVLFVQAARAMSLSDPWTSREPDVTVIGHQWWWEVRYPNGAVTANEIHIPTQSDVLVRVDSADVIHSFWVPQLGRKMDAIPGHPNQLWIRADQGGEYQGTCSEFCGAQHAWMRIIVLAQPPEEYRDWVAQEAKRAIVPAVPAAVRGEKVFREKTCGVCHTIRGVTVDTQVGPDLTHFASRRSIGTGVLPNSPDEVRRWLTEPQRIKPQCHMPDFHLTAAELEDLTALLVGLK
jgi:cytochrome c oxidase subunit 2